MKQIVQCFLILTLLLPATAALGQAMPSVGTDLLSGQTVEIKSGKKGAVVVFLSCRCPCSGSHNSVLKNLSQEFKEFAFYAIHSNADEEVDEAKAYFQNVDLGFPVLQDENAKLADQLKASRTPHAYVFNAKGELKFKGGPTDSREGTTAGKQYLREALKALSSDKPVRVAEARPLGCAISRQ